MARVGETMQVTKSAYFSLFFRKKGNATYPKKMCEITDLEITKPTYYNSKNVKTITPEPVNHKEHVACGI